LVVFVFAFDFSSLGESYALPVSHVSEISMSTPLTFSQVLEVRRRFLWASGKAKTAKPSGRFSAAQAASLESP
jgi:hypothetical protein